MTGRRRFDEDVAVVTGSTRGIGAATARRLADEGASVVVSGRSKEAGQAVVARIEDRSGEATFVETDVRDPHSVEELVDVTIDEYGAVDVVVNNAAVQTDTGADDATAEDWTRVVETDFRGYWLCAREAVRRSAPRAVVNVSSNHAHHTMPDLFPYNAVKAGVEGMTRAMCLDFGPTTRVNSVTPGWIAVERTTGGMTEEERSSLAAIHPVGRIGRPDDVAGAVAFLASEEAGFVSGASLLVDGGRGAVMQDDTLPDYRAKRD